MKLESDFIISITNKVFVLDYDAVSNDQMKQINAFNGLNLSERTENLVDFVEELIK